MPLGMAFFLCFRPAVQFDRQLFAGRWNCGVRKRLWDHEKIGGILTRINNWFV